MNWQNIIVLVIVAAAVIYSVVRAVRRVRKAKKGVVDCGCGCGADCLNCPLSCKGRNQH